MTDDSGWDQCGGSGGGEQWLDSGGFEGYRSRIGYLIGREVWEKKTLPGGLRTSWPEQLEE